MSAPSNTRNTSNTANPPWRYGVYAFLLVPLLSAVSYVGLFAGFSGVQETPSVFVIGLVLTFLSQWVAIILALVVFTALILDVRALAERDDGEWTPNPYLYGVGGLVHVAGAFLVAPYVLSVPALSYYVYRRRQRVG